MVVEELQSLLIAVYGGNSHATPHCGYTNAISSGSLLSREADHLRLDDTMLARNQGSCLQ
jgi:hypothetical protein